MAALFERPNADERWQRNTRTVTMCDCDVPTATRQNVVAVIGHAFDNPVSIADDEQLRSRQADADRQRNLHSLLHQADLLCRRLVSACMKPLAAPPDAESHSEQLAALVDRGRLPADSRERLALVSSAKQKVLESVRTAFDRLDSTSLEQFVATAFVDELTRSGQFIAHAQ